MGEFIAHPKSTFCILHTAQLHYGTLCTERFRNHWHSTNKLLSLVGSHVLFDVIHVTFMLRCMCYFWLKVRLKKKSEFSLSLSFPQCRLYMVPLGYVVCMRRNVNLFCAVCHVSDSHVQRALGSAMMDHLIAE